MDKQKIEQAVHFAANVGPVCIATVDNQGMPHVDAAGQIDLGAEDNVYLTRCFGPQTLMDLKQNDHIAVLIWNEQSQDGYQLIGQCSKIEEISEHGETQEMFDAEQAYYKGEQRLTVHVDKVSELKQKSSSGA
ncbi:Pyridoxamine 5'-phosphate oxidase [Anaerohalosphaera lusitana]|uniref:Pyridoxamine 5'-phosphate oxidase n=1 Tax=Anaerohalosphaera lusitana TaxID=1936003 RepID=A0A1U9NJQ7_9BACT|nr:pyridoxamine 5'-phosphate oxidase family protein [Anaerohalosphaera lusitana]AQT67974.1 Pyridoxamine 5'-phosphate oxidase [Anaerohalosphaera lusitana]